MKGVIQDYIRIVMYTIFGIIFAMASYVIILNIHHYRSLSTTVTVSEIDADYSKYKENVLLIEKSLNSDTNEYLSLTKVLNTMKQNGAYRLIPNAKLKYKDLYQLNDYFIEELINNSWVSYLQNLEVSKDYQDTIDMLISNSKYLNTVFTGNSIILYDNSLDNKIEDNYHFILKNYMMYSNVILSMCKDLGDVNG